MKRYRLLKDLPGADAGAIFELKSDNLRVYQLNDLRYLVHCGMADKHLPAISIDYLNSDWFEEVKEIPEDQAWVVPGKTYRLIGFDIDFTPSKYDFGRETWEGFVGSSFRNFNMNDKGGWAEHPEPEKPKRKAPAYVWIGDDWDTYGLYASEQEAKDGTISFKKFEWPALPDSEGYYPGPKGKG